MTYYYVEAAATGEMTRYPWPTLADARAVVADVTEWWRIRDADTLAVVAEGNRPPGLHG